MKKRLYRSRDERMIWGVCGGIARYFDVDPTVVRVIAVLTLVLGCMGILIYLILTIVMPLEPLPSDFDIGLPRAYSPGLRKG